MKENEELKKRISKFEFENPNLISNLASGSDLYDIEYSFTIQEKNSISNTWRRAGIGIEFCSISWNEIFLVYATQIIKNSYAYADSLFKFIRIKEKDKITTKYPGKQTMNYKISSKSMETILIQLRSLKLIESNINGLSLTKNGEIYLSDFLAIKKTVK